MLRKYCVKSQRSLSICSKQSVGVWTLNSEDVVLLMILTSKHLSSKALHLGLHGFKVCPHKIDQHFQKILEI